MLRLRQFSNCSRISSRPTSTKLLASPCRARHIGTFTQSSRGISRTFKSLKSSWSMSCNWTSPMSKIENFKMLWAIQNLRRGWTCKSSASRDPYRCHNRKATSEESRIGRQVQASTFASQISSRKKSMPWATIRNTWQNHRYKPRRASFQASMATHSSSRLELKTLLSISHSCSHCRRVGTTSGNKSWIRSLSLSWNVNESLNQK